MNAQENGEKNGRRLRVLGSAVAAGVTAVGLGVVGIGGAGTASATPISRTISYGCTINGTTEQVNLSQVISTTVRGQAYTGEELGKVPFLSVFTFAPGDAWGLFRGHSTEAPATVEGVTGSLGAPHIQKLKLSGANNYNFVFRSGIDQKPLPIDHGQSFDLPSYGNFISIVLDNAGANTYTVGDITLKLITRNGAGQVVSPGVGGNGYITLDCKAKTGQNTTLANFDTVTPPARKR